MKHALELVVTPIGLLSAGLLVFAAWAFWKAQTARLRWLVAVIALVCYAPTTPWFANWALGKLENDASALARCPQPPPASVIIVLAGGVRGEPRGPEDYEDLSLASLRRTLAASELALRTPRSRLVLSGGAGGRWREADLMAALAGRMGVPPSRLLEDRSAMNTYASALDVGAMLGGDRAPRYLVTSAFHMRRAWKSFRHTGQLVCAWPVDFRARPVDPAGMLLPQATALEKSALAWHEWIGTLAYEWLRFR